MNSAAPSFSQQYLRSRMGKVCVAIIGSTAAEMVDRAPNYAGQPFPGIPPGLPGKATHCAPQAKAILAENSVVTAIATCRAPPTEESSRALSQPNWTCFRKPPHPGFTWWIWSCRRPRPLRRRSSKSCAHVARRSSSPTTIFRRPKIWMASLSASGLMSRSSSRSCPPPRLWPTTWS